MNGATLSIDDRVVGTQQTFTAIMHAMAEPGSVRLLDTAYLPPLPSADLSPSTCCVLITLVDTTTPVFLDPQLDSATLRNWITFQTGAPIVVDPTEAMFALVPSSLDDLSPFSMGTDLYPDRACTLIVETGALEEPTKSWQLSGPGIKTTSSLATTALPGALKEARDPLSEEFPRGLDFILCHGETLAALPRTTRIEGI